MDEETDRFPLHTAARGGQGELSITLTHNTSFHVAHDMDKLPGPRDYYRYGNDSPTQSHSHGPSLCD